MRLSRVAPVLLWVPSVPLVPTTTTFCRAKQRNAGNDTEWKLSVARQGAVEDREHEKINNLHRKIDLNKPSADEMPKMLFTQGVPSTSGSQESSRVLRGVTRFHETFRNLLKLSVADESCRNCPIVQQQSQKWYQVKFTSHVYSLWGIFHTWSQCFISNRCLVPKFGFLLNKTREARNQLQLETVDESGANLTSAPPTASRGRLALA